MKATEVIQAIVSGNYSEADLRSINSAVRSAMDIAKQQKVAVMKATLKAGDKVILSGLSPKAINGLTAEVVEVNRAKATVNMPTDFRAGRWSGAKSVRVPLSCVTLA